METSPTFEQDDTDPTHENPVEFVIDKLEEYHVDPFLNVSKEALQEALTEAFKTEEQFRNIAVQEALALMGDSHTVVDYYAFEQLPIKVRWICDGIFVIATSEDVKDLLGSKILSLNGHLVDDIAPKLLKLSSQENAEVILGDLSRHIISNRILKYYGFNSGGVVELDTDKGKFSLPAEDGDKVPKITEFLNPFDWESVDPESVVGNRTYRYRMVGDTLLFQYNRCSNNGYTESELRQFKRSLLKAAKNADKMVVDLRRNQGGATSVMGGLFEKLPPDLDYYVAIGRESYSSAMHHMLFLRRERNAVLVGENAGQKPNRFGDTKYIELPHLDLCIHCSFKYFELLPGQDIDIIAPDIPIRVTIEDYKSGNDPLDEWIKNL